MLGESRVMCRFYFLHFSNFFVRLSFFVFLNFLYFSHFFINFSHLFFLSISLICLNLVFWSYSQMYIGGALLCGSSCGENCSSTHWSVESTCWNKAFFTEIVKMFTFFTYNLKFWLKNLTFKFKVWNFYLTNFKSKYGQAILRRWQLIHHKLSESYNCALTMTNKTISV